MAGQSRTLTRLLTALGVTASVIGAASGQTDGEAAERELLRERVEGVRAGRIDLIRGASIASATVLPAVYERRGFRRTWTAPGKPEQLLQAIRDAESDGLDPRDYHLSALDSLKGEIASSTPAPMPLLVDFDLLLTDALIRLGYHLMFGKVDFQRYDPVWNYGREIHDLDPPVAVQNAIDAPDLRTAVEREKPAHRVYAQLKAHLASYRALQAAGGWHPVPRGPTLRPGDADPRVRALRSRLAVTGDLPAPPAATDGELYDAALGEGVRAFQRRHGLEADGVIGPQTLEELNAPVEARIDQIRVNQERGRWLLHDIGGEFVIVNVAGFRLYYVEDGEPIWMTRVQVGKPYRSTPIFRSKITYLVFNPTWTVPPGILAQDILPAQKRDPSTLARKGLKVLDAKGKEVDPAALDWSGYSTRNFPYTLRQDPGPTNALGRVKFMFPNEHAVYLHDTPSQALFEKEERAFSSGCIRVHDPLMLAELLLRGESGWGRAQIESAIQAGESRSVTLAEPIPVLLAYWTAWDEDGLLHFRRDLYGHDAKVLHGLESPFRFRERPPIVRR